MSLTPEPQSGNPPDGLVAVDIVVVGGGIAGLWILNVVRNAGFSALLVEADHLGCGQTLASQGIVHSGVKYALGAKLTRASEAIATMPDRWRRCLAGDGEVDLSGVTLASSDFYMFAAADARSKLAGFFASRALGGRINAVSPNDFPPQFAGFRGSLYRMDDFVVDVADVLTTLAAPHRNATIRATIDPTDVLVDAASSVTGVRINNTTINAACTIFAAGAGNESLIAGIEGAPTMQRRPLHQVLVRAPDLPTLHAHCLTRIHRPEPRLTITSHDGVWYLGGQIATDGVSRTSADLAEHARNELAECVSWLNWDHADITTLTIDRAEPEQSGRQRPDEAYVAAIGGGLVCWPTKLTLAPDLGDKVLRELARLGLAPRCPQPSVDSERPEPGLLPW